MVGLLDDEQGPEPKPEQEQTPVLAYLSRFFRLPALRYDQLVVRVLDGEEPIISIVEVLGVSKTMCGLISHRNMARELGMGISEVVEQLTNEGSKVVKVGESTPIQLIRRKR